MKFTNLAINERIKKALAEIGFDDMMPIQEEAIPVILNGENIIGEAETGTGKTAAFVIPLLEKLEYKTGKPEVLIVTPTRELAMQIVTEIKKLGKYLKPSYATLVGGMSISEQVRELKNKPAIVVGTLGRINDHLRNKKLDLSGIKYFVLDEADEMLKDGFKEDITIINEQIPQTKQTLLFSATISKQIQALSKTIMDDYHFVSVKDKNNISVNIEQYYITMKEKDKFNSLTKLLDIDNPASAIIFGRTKRRVDELDAALNKCGYKSVGIHGDLSQGQRNAVMRKFREKQINILVATDVAARGLDISDISHVYNFDLPQEVEFYIHRIGRTGRAKKHGVSYSFIKDSEIEHIRRIERETNVKILPKNLPGYSEIGDVRNQVVIDLISKKLGEIDITRTKDFADVLLEQYGSEKLVSVLIELLSKKTDINKIALTGEPPVVVRKKNFGNKKSFSQRNNRKGESRVNGDRNRRIDRKAGDSGKKFNRRKPKYQD